jgi:futalosine hydrolase
MITDICSMYILLAAATTLEIQATIDFLENTAPGPGDHETGVLITGVGSVATTYLLTGKIGDRCPDLVIQAGIAGCFTGRPPGEVVAVGEEWLADLGVWEGHGFRTLADLGLTGKDTPPFRDGALVNPYKKLLALSGLEQVRGITVNEITTSRDRLKWYQQNLAPVVESMEGGALHYVCLRENIPFIQIRSVSNDAGERDKTKWNIGAAVRQLNERLIALLKAVAAENGPFLAAEKSEK